MPTIVETGSRGGGSQIVSNSITFPMADGVTINLGFRPKIFIMFGNHQAYGNSQALYYANDIDSTEVTVLDYSGGGAYYRHSFISITDTGVSIQSFVNSTWGNFTGTYYAIK